jgi:hypothetical protein
MLIKGSPIYCNTSLNILSISLFPPFLIFVSLCFFLTSLLCETHSSLVTHADTSVTGRVHNVDLDLEGAHKENMAAPHLAAMFPDAV